MHFLRNRFTVAIVALSSVTGEAAPTTPGRPFLVKVDNETAIIGNDIWNVTIGRQYGTKLMYKGADRVGEAVGHYVSYNGAASDLNLTNARVYHKTKDYTDIVFTATEGDFHWVLTPTLAGAYQYFVNKALPDLGEFRTLWRLDNSSFTYGYNFERDELLPPLSDILAANKTQDETWQRADGSYITKYDFSEFLPTIEDQIAVWGVYGEDVGSWYIHGGKDYFNGDHLKQELTVHRESATGDTVQLNMIHGTHFQSYSNDSFPVGKTWGPWLWYLNDGSSEDARARAEAELATWPYPWVRDAAVPDYHSRGSVTGRITLSDGRPASNASIFLGDNNSDQPTLQQGATYYYRTYADADGSFEISDVRAKSYALHAWATGGSIGDVLTNYTINDVQIKAKKTNKLGGLTWQLPEDRTTAFLLGSSDRKATGFNLSGPPHEHARAANCPANLTYTISESSDEDWCFAQTQLGEWTIAFTPPANISTTNASTPDALLTVALAGFSSGSSARILVNENIVGNISVLPSDPSVYRSGTEAGEAHLIEVPVDGNTLRPGVSNEVTFQVTRSTALRGWIWNAVKLEWV